MYSLRLLLQLYCNLLFFVYACAHASNERMLVEGVRVYEGMLGLQREHPLGLFLSFTCVMGLQTRVS